MTAPNPKRRWLRFSLRTAMVSNFGLSQKSRKGVGYGALPIHSLPGRISRMAHSASAPFIELGITALSLPESRPRPKARIA